MTLQRWLSAVLLTLGVLLYVQQARAQSGIVTEYEVRFGPFEVMTVHGTTEIVNSGYRTTAEMQTVGPASYIFPWHSSAITEGQRKDGELRPLRHHSSSEYRGEARSVAIDYALGGAIVATLDPTVDVEFRDPVPVALQQDTIDPLTATLHTLASHCEGTLHVFDGRRRYDLALQDLGDAEVPTGTVYAGRARRCQSEIRPLAGFSHPGASNEDQPSHIDYWIAVPQPGLPPVPVYMELSSPRGTLSVYLTAVAPSPVRALP